jgi:hypothetical protein
VPQEYDWLSGYILDGPIGIVIAVRSRENDDAEFHPGFLAEGLYFEFNMGLRRRRQQEASKITDEFG